MKGETNSQLVSEDGKYISQEEFDNTMGGINDSLEIIIGGVGTNQILSDIINQ